MELVSTINDKDKKDFLRPYLKVTEDFENAAIKRAYRDFNRTLRGMPASDDARAIFRLNWINVLKEKLAVLLTREFATYEEFEKWHQATCYRLRTANKDYPLSQGQAQKWINMTLKYLFALGEDNVKGISRNYRFFHIPIDNIIQAKLKAVYGIERFNTPWSKIHDYDDYSRYQQDVREALKGQIPMDIEFKLFNKELPGRK